MRAWMVGAVIAASLLGGAARAETLTYAVEMRGTSEVPPNDSAGTGSARVDFDTATRNLAWAVTYSGLTGPATGMHFHGSTEPGRNAGILLPLRGNLESPVTGNATLTETQAADLVGGKWYLNIHTAKHPGGEVRGQVSR